MGKVSRGWVSWVVGYLGEGIWRDRVSRGRVYPRYPTPQTTKAGGMHPTGMLSCYYKELIAKTLLERLFKTFHLVQFLICIFCGTFLSMT